MLHLAGTAGRIYYKLSSNRRLSRRNDLSGLGVSVLCRSYTYTRQGTLPLRWIESRLRLVAKFYMEGIS